MTPRECAAAALELIRDPAHWTQGAHARTTPGLPGHVGRRVSTLDPSATCWCGEGAIAKIAGTDPERDDDDHAGYQLYRDTMKLVCTHGAMHEDAPAICWVNDKQGHAETVAVFNRALSATA